MFWVGMVFVEELTIFFGCLKDDLDGMVLISLLRCADAWGEYPPCNPPIIAGRKGGAGTGMEGLARDGARWPSGARPTPSQTLQVARGEPQAESPRRPDTEAQRNQRKFFRSASLRLCVFAVEFRPRMQMGVP